MYFPFLRHDEQQTSTRRERARDFPQHGSRFAHVFKRDNVHTRVECAFAKRQRTEIANHVQFAVVPIRVAHSQIEPHVALPHEIIPVGAFARPGIQHASVFK